MPDLTYHLVARSYWESCDPQADYGPADFERDGFIHCTDAPDEMGRVANAYYQSNPEPHLYLYIDKAHVNASIRYDDPDRRYPHIYGALNREAILAVRPARRQADGTFLPPDLLVP